MVPLRSLASRRAIQRAAGGKNLEILGQCLRRGLVDEILVFVLPVLLGDGIRFFSSRTLPG